MKPSEVKHAATIVLTATIRVRANMSMTVRTSTSLRLADYRESFLNWLSNRSVQRIVFVENSGYDLSEFEHLARMNSDKSVELLSFVCPDFPGERGKGYGEMFCLDYALRNSRLLEQSRHFIKTSGRYYLRNVQRLVNFLERHPELEVVCNLERNLTWADSRAFAGSVDFLRKYLIPFHETVDDSHGVCFENVLARAAHNLMACGGAWTMLPMVPEIVGVHATNNIKFRLTPWRIAGKRMLHGMRTRLLGSRYRSTE